MEDNYSSSLFFSNIIMKVYLMNMLNEPRFEMPKFDTINSLIVEYYVSVTVKSNALAPIISNATSVMTLKGYTRPLSRLRPSKS